MNGVLIINKPGQFTSFDTVALLRGITKQRKIGHCGTLDPNATGVLPILLGKATKAQDIIPNHDKEYRAALKFGFTSDTLDIWGNVASVCKPKVSASSLSRALDGFRGEIMQTPPMYSAVQINGQRLYDLARKGIEVERKSRRVTVYKLECLDFNEEEQTAQIAVKCSKGTYIRSLIDDIGKALGCGAVMTSLERTCACGYNISEAITLREVQSLADSGTLEKYIRSTESLFKNYREIFVTEKQCMRFSNGGALDIKRTSLAFGAKDTEIVRIKSRNSGFIGLGTVDLEKQAVKIFKLFNC